MCLLFVLARQGVVSRPASERGLRAEGAKAHTREARRIDANLASTTRRLVREFADDGSAVRVLAGDADGTGARSPGMQQLIDYLEVRAAARVPPFIQLPL